MAATPAPAATQPAEPVPAAAEPAHTAKASPTRAQVTPAQAADGSESYQRTPPAMAPQGEPPAGNQPAPPPAAPEEKAPAAAVATLKDMKGKEVGTMRFEQDGEWVVMTGTFSKLPAGKRAIQLRENGDCGGKNASRAGGHFNPTKSKHGPPEAAERHVGDFGNITVAKDGTAQFEMRTDAMTVLDGETSVVGRAVVITRNPDDGKSQPSGNSGPVIACGVVRAETPSED